jgi:hypothetical protein
MTPADDNEASSNSDRRHGERSPALLGGKIVSGGVTYDCVIRNLSSTGARIKLAVETVQPPIEFHLIEIRGGMGHLCRVVWERPPWIGLSFKETWDLRTAPPREHPELRRLWIECAPRTSDLS